MADIDFFDENTIRNLGYTQIAEEHGMAVYDVKRAIAELSREQRRFLTKVFDRNEKRYQTKKKQREEKASSRLDKTSTPEAMSDEERLKLLEEQKAKVEQEIALHESNKKNVLSVAATGEQEIKNLNREIQELQKEITEKKIRITQVNEGLLYNSKELVEVQKELAAARRKFSEISAKIELLKKKKVLVTADGFLKVDDGVVIPEEWTSQYSEFLRPEEVNKTLDEKLENLTRREIKTLAKLITLLEMFKAQGQRYEVVFDNESIKEAYKILDTKEE